MVQHKWILCEKSADEKHLFYKNVWEVVFSTHTSKCSRHYIHQSEHSWIEWSKWESWNVSYYLCLGLQCTSVELNNKSQKYNDYLVKTLASSSSSSLLSFDLSHLSREKKLSSPFRFLPMSTFCSTLHKRTFFSILDHVIIAEWTCIWLKEVLLYFLNVNILDVGFFIISCETVLE